MTLYLTQDEVKSILDMKSTLEAVESAFMEMAIYDIGSFFDINCSCLEKKKDIDIKLMDRRTGFQLPVPGDIYHPSDVKSFQITAVMVGDYYILIAIFFQGLHLTQYPHMAAPIGKEGCGDYI